MISHREVVDRSNGGGCYHVAATMHMVVKVKVSCDSNDTKHVILSQLTPNPLQSMILRM